MLQYWNVMVGYKTTWRAHPNSITAAASQSCTGVSKLNQQSCRTGNLEKCNLLQLTRFQFSKLLETSWQRRRDKMGRWWRKLRGKKSHRASRCRWWELCERLKDRPWMHLWYIKHNEVLSVVGLCAKKKTDKVPSGVSFQRKKCGAVPWRLPYMLENELASTWTVFCVLLLQRCRSSS